MVALALRRSGIEQHVDRQFEHRLNFVGCRPQRQAGRQQPQYWSNAIARVRHVVRHQTEYLDLRTVERNLLLRLAQRGGCGIFVLRVDPAAGEADLPAVLVQMRVALG